MSLFRFFEAWEAPCRSGMEQPTLRVDKILMLGFLSLQTWICGFRLPLQQIGWVEVLEPVGYDFL